MDFEYLKRKRILLVDDEQELLNMVVSILKEEGFCNIATAKTVKEALDLADSFAPELAILDVKEPEIYMYRQIFYHKDKWKTREMEEFIRVAKMDLK